MDANEFAQESSLALAKGDMARFRWLEAGHPSLALSHYKAMAGFWAALERDLAERLALAEEARRDA